MARERVPARYDGTKNSSGELDLCGWKYSKGSNYRAHVSCDEETAFFYRHRKQGRLDVELRGRLQRRVYAKGVAFDMIYGMCCLAGDTIPEAPYHKSIRDGYNESNMNCYSDSFYDRYAKARKSSPFFAKILKNFALEDIVQMYEFCLENATEHDLFTLNMMGFTDIVKQS